jgi:AraC-like DNA-binding protein
VAYVKENAVALSLTLTPQELQTLDAARPSKLGRSVFRLCESNFAGETSQPPPKFSMLAQKNKFLARNVKGVSVRTLTRLLASEGCTFSQILDALRLDLAKSYLREQNLPISEVSWLLGYREGSAFDHACKRWTGKTPTQLRSVGVEALPNAA